MSDQPEANTNGQGPPSHGVVKVDRSMVGPDGVLNLPDIEGVDPADVVLVEFGMRLTRISDSVRTHGGDVFYGHRDAVLYALGRMIGPQSVAQFIDQLMAQPAPEPAGPRLILPDSD